MKTSLTLLLVLLSFAVKSQLFRGGTTELTIDEQNKLKKSLVRYDVISLNPSEIKKYIRTQKSSNINFTLTLPSGNYDLALIENDVRAPQYKSVFTSDDRRETITYQECPTYKGIVNGNDKLHARLLITDDCFGGFIASNEQYIYTGLVHKKEEIPKSV